MVTHQNIFLTSVPVVKSVALTIFIVFARCTLARFGPFMVSKGLKFVLPDFIKIVGVDSALSKAPVDIGTGGDGSVD